MLNSVSDQSRFATGLDHNWMQYGRRAGATSAGLSVDQIYQINQLASVQRLGVNQLQLGEFNTLNPKNNLRLPPSGASSTVSFSPTAKLQSAAATLGRDLAQLGKTRDPLRASLSEPELANAKALNGGGSTAAQSLVVNQLAQAQTSQSDVFSSQDSALGSGELSIRFGIISALGEQTSNAKSVTVKVAASDSLQDVARNIERAAPQLNTSISGNTAAGFRLLLSNSTTGAEQAFTLGARSDSQNQLSKLTVTADQARNSDNRAQDAIVQLNNRELRSANNTINDPKSGLQLELKKTGSSNIALQRDDAQLAENFQQLIDNLNQYRSQLRDVGSGLGQRELNKIDETLNGLSVGVGNERLALSDLGITTARDGKLIVNETRLSQQALARSDTVNSLFNQALDQLANRSKTVQQEASLLNSSVAANLIYRPTQSATQATGGASQLSLLQAGEQTNRAWYGISQYLAVSQL
jgi:flagellar hook-associated protein 2